MPKITTRNLPVACNFDEDYCTCSVKEKHQAGLHVQRGGAHWDFPPPA